MERKSEAGRLVGGCYKLLHTEVIMLVHKIVKFSKEIPFLELLSGQDKNLLNKKWKEIEKSISRLLLLQ